MDLAAFGVLANLTFTASVKPVITRKLDASFVGFRKKRGQSWRITKISGTIWIRFSFRPS
jgi:hypothetical protein